MEHDLSGSPGPLYYDPAGPIIFTKTISLDEARQMFPEYSEMPVEVMAADDPEPRMVPILRSDTEAAQRALQVMSDFIQDRNRDLFLEASLYSGWAIAERLRRGGA